MRIEIWSDVVCPWCYIGKRRLESALATFDHADDVEVVWRSYQLDPSAPKDEVVTTVEALGAKFPGGPAQVTEMHARTRGIAAEEGLEFGDHSFHANTVDAHRVLHLALETGGPELQGQLKEALLHAHFVDNRHVGDARVLTEVATSVGLPADRVAAVLASEEYAASVADDVAQARAYGATGVPFFVVDAKYGISGAQPVEVFSQVLEQAWADSHPAIAVVGGDAEACGPDGCAI
ncbi:DsbA family oxidoreductase [Nocardioides daphniae]|uniref:DSBA oxidoreductase n=1 Tax=Nocardioides daphniae TaxID=402297 RepID=A0A4P7UB02_9ACTN|nr:DsbA family oxidoreductase [Nocardioides daphniae]QCC76864.1 DsbA family oxidoreductase [Nocardioides daphniae]GGD17220.1 DSBA oxidoreductase [Nocardioides daphniae]